MASGPSGSLIRNLDLIVNAGTVAGMTDAELLRRFISRRDGAAEVAFGALAGGDGQWPSLPGSGASTLSTEPARAGPDGLGRRRGPGAPECLGGGPLRLARIDGPGRDAVRGRRDRPGLDTHPHPGSSHC